MNTIKKGIGLCGVITLLCFGNIIAQSQFTEKAKMNNVGKRDGIYYLLLCKLQPNVSSKMLGTFTLESAKKDSICNICNVCDIQVNVSSIDNKMVINNMCNNVNANILIVQYGNDEYFSVELIDITNIADISFTGIAENKSLLLVNENAVTVNNNSRNNPTRSSGWETSGNDIFYNGGNVGIRNMYPSEKLHINGKLYLQHNNIVDSWGASYIQWPGHRLIMGNPASSNGHISLELRPEGNNLNLLYSQFQLYTAPQQGQQNLKVQIHSDGISYFNGGNVGIGTSNPTSKLTVSGNILSSTITASNSDQNSGGAISLVNETKTSPNQAKTWNIYNMSGTYGNSLQFWAYDNIGCLGGLCHARLILMDNGNVGIGTSATSTTHKLTVAGDISAREINVTANAGADFVFSPSYPLRPISELEQFITENKHLPDIAPADTMIQNGVNMGEFQIQLLQKIEELTLYVIEQEKRIKELESKLQTKQTKTQE